MTLEPVPLDSDLHSPGTRMRHWLEIEWKIRPFVITHERIQETTTHGHVPQTPDDVGQALLAEGEDAPHRTAMRTRYKNA